MSRTMAPILHFLVISLSCSLLFSLSSESQDSQSLSHSRPQPTSTKPNLLVLPVQQDAYTGLHWVNIHKRTPLMQLPLLLDLNGKHLWVTCEQHYSSSTYQAPFCHSTQCSRANTHLCFTCTNSASRPGCHNNTCGVMSTNPMTQETGLSELAQDVLAIHATHGTKLGQMVRVPQFLFSCAPSFLVQKGLPKNVQGVVGLGHAPISLPNQLASYFGLKRQFMMCLSRFPKSNGAIIFGDDPNNIFMRNTLDVTHDLVYTPLTISRQGEYYMQVSAIRVNKHTVVPVKNPSLLSYHESSTSTSSGSVGGTMISTTNPYTTLHHSIFEAFVQVYASQIPKQAIVKAVGAPYALCFDSKKISTFPNVELVMDKPNVVWSISGENLVVQSETLGVTCLAIVDGGLHAKAGIVMGTRQLEENLVVFDLARSRVGFSTSSLYSRGKTCATLFDLNYSQHP